jgi:hypothetical protein
VEQHVRPSLTSDWITPAGDRAVGVALDLDDPLVLDEDTLAAADRAVRAHRAGHPIGGSGAPAGGGARGHGRRPAAKLATYVVEKGKPLLTLVE